jgi:hypothetical protein
MKKIIIIAGSVLVTVFLIGIATLYFGIRIFVNKNIELAQKKYPGNAEDALISFMMDESNSFNDRTHKAIWTLGVIKSQKALPFLKSLYKDDPEGKTCYKNHSSMLCQYEIYKAISTIETGRLFTYEKYKK